MKNIEFGFTKDLFRVANSTLRRCNISGPLRERYPNYPPRFGGPGANEQQISAVESHLDQVLPPDLRWLVANTHDPDGYFFPWVQDVSDIDSFRDWVFRGIAAHISGAMDWLSAWGPRPEDKQERLDIFTTHFTAWPKLLPVYGHRAIPVSPTKPGNPVFSIMETDIIYYGTSLANWISIEFANAPEAYARNLRIEEARHIPVWSDFAEQTPGFLASEGLTPEDRAHYQAAMASWLTPPKPSKN